MLSAPCLFRLRYHHHRILYVMHQLCKVFVPFSTIVPAQWQVNIDMLHYIGMWGLHYKNIIR